MLPFFFYPVERKVMVNHGEVNDYQVFMTVSLIAFIISGIVYPILSYVAIGKYQRVVNQNFSYNEKINLNWLKYCIWGIGLVYLTVALISVLREGVGVEFGFNADMIFYSQIILFVFCIGYFGIKHEGIFSQNSTAENEIAEVEEKTAGTYKKSGLKQENAEEIHQHLLKLMHDKKPYLEPKLTLSGLAGELNVSVNNLSQIINQYQKKNFYDFINEYRVEEFKSRMAVPKNRSFSILAIALDSGFNSKSSFNQVFKKHTGITPSQYVAEIYPAE
jgi:AraC-like DNA-binding protein